MISKEQFESLFSDTITKKQYDAIIVQIDERFGEICEKFIQKTSKNRSWYVYGNLFYEDEHSEGFFDPEEYKEYVEIGGEWIEPPPGYDLKFPTRWLWEDFDEELKQTISEYKNQENLKKIKAKEEQEAKKKKISILKKRIHSKLTPEEFKIIKFID
jgi:hypothetical protein